MSSWYIGPLNLSDYRGKQIVYIAGPTSRKSIIRPPRQGDTSVAKSPDNKKGDNKKATTKDQNTAGKNK